MGTVGDVTIGAHRGEAAVTRGRPGVARIAVAVLLVASGALFLWGPGGPHGAAPAVRVDRLNIASGADRAVAGTRLILTGDGLDGVSRAEIGGSYAEIRVRDTQHLELVVPAVAQTSTTLELYRGQAPCVSVPLALTDSDDPFVNPLSPGESAGPYAPGAVLVVRGSHLDAVTAVSIGDADADVLTRTDRELRVTIPDQISGGEQAVTVVHGDDVLSRQRVTLTRPRVVFLGDSYTSGAGASSPSRSAAVLIAERMGWDVDNRAYGGTGYGKPLDHAIAQSACGLEHCPSYREALESIPEPPDVLVVFGGRNQAHELPGAVAEQVEGFFARARELFPSTDILVVDPLWDDDPLPDTMRQMRQSVHAAAQSYGVRYLDLGDPLENRPDLVGEDGVHPNDAGYQEIADDFLRVVRQPR